MNRTEFEEAITFYGADLTRWPAEVAERGRVLVAKDSAAARMLEQAERLDTLLRDSVRPGVVDAALIGRIIAGPPKAAGREMIVRPTGRLFAWASGAMAMFLVVGFVLGMSMPIPVQDDDGLSVLLFGAGDLGTGVSDGGLL
jgi:hypothetical protein